MALQPHPLPLAALAPCLAKGWQVFLRARRISLTVGAVFALLGSLLLAGAVGLGLAPMGLPLVGGFLLVGPVVMAGLVGVSRAVAEGRTPEWGAMLAAWRASPSGLGAVALFCGLMYFIWLGDAGTLYSFLVEEGGAASLLPIRPDVLRFHLSSAVMGLGLALLVFVATVHAVPLLASGRARLVEAIVASVRAVFRSPLSHGVWGVLLAAGIFAGLLAPPVLILSLPVLAYAGHALHRVVFPPP